MILKTLRTTLHPYIKPYILQESVILECRVEKGPPSKCIVCRVAHIRPDFNVRAYRQNPMFKAYNTNQSNKCFFWVADISDCEVVR